MNLYATLDQLKTAINVTGSTYDDILIESLRRAARLIDTLTGRQFYPTLATRHFDGSGNSDLWLPEPLLTATTVSLSSDLGVTYTALVANTDYWVSNGREYDKTPYQLLRINPNGDYSVWYANHRAVKIVDIFGYHTDYAQAWPLSGDSVQDSGGITAVATSITVADGNGADDQGVTPRFSCGNLLKIEDEFLQLASVSTNTLTVVRAVNGTTAATHAKDKLIYVWRPEPIVTQATLIQGARWFKRGQQAYADASASVELGQLIYARQLDPDIEGLLFAAGLRRLAVG